MILPVEREYNRILRNRICLDFHVKCTPDLFSYESKYAIENLLKCLVDAEKKNEIWRQKLYRFPSFSSKLFFYKLDMGQKNYISHNDVC